MRRLRYAGWWLVHEVKYALMLLGYRLRPYDSHLDARRWRWQRSGCLRSRIAWRQHPELARAEREVIAPCDRCGRPIYIGRPYVMVRPGVFAHRGPCQVVR